VGAGVAMSCGGGSRVSYPAVARHVAKTSCWPMLGFSNDPIVDACEPARGHYK
jgi:hypothetical protein